MNKQFSILQVGYTRGVYGVTGEYFTCVYTDINGLNSFSFYGMYGSDDRVANAMKKLGYNYKYLATDYGKMLSSEVNRNLFQSEYTVIDPHENLLINL